MKKKSYELDHLLNLYNKWKINPSLYNEDMKITVDKIIHTTLSRQSLNPYYRRFEDQEDLLQDLRLLCFQVLSRIENPTNKRIYNFLRVSISLALKDKSRKVGKRMDREPLENSVLGEKLVYPSNTFSFGDSLLENIAFLLSHEEKKSDICKKLGISYKTLNRSISKLRELYK